MDLFFSLAVALLAGLFLSRLAKKLGLPAVTAYLVAGVLMGPYVLGQLAQFAPFAWLSHFDFSTPERVENLHIITDVALGFIAFSIGSEFRIPTLKKIGKQAAIIGMFQAVFTTLVVDAFLIGLHFLIPDVLSLPAAIVLGAVASATAPATTLMVVKQYKAKGKLTSLLLPIVALDDAVGLILFAVSFGIAKGIGTGQPDVISILVDPLLEIFCSLALGALLGFIFTWAERFFHSRSKRLSISVAFVLLTVGFSFLKIPVGSATISFSSLLSCMMLGTVFCNICDFSEELMDRLDRWTGPIYVLFFVCSGALLDLTVFTEIAIVGVGVAYVVTRVVGKYFGNSISCYMTKCEPKVSNNLGIAMLPQAGVALGMASIAATGLGDDGEFIRLITLFGVLIFELVCPMLSKIALTRAGDIDVTKKTSFRGVHEKHHGRHVAIIDIPEAPEGTAAEAPVATKEDNQDQ